MSIFNQPGGIASLLLEDQMKRGWRELCKEAEEGLKVMIWEDFYPDFTFDYLTFEDFLKHVDDYVRQDTFETVDAITIKIGTKIWYRGT